MICRYFYIIYMHAGWNLAKTLPAYVKVKYNL